MDPQFQNLIDRLNNFSDQFVDLRELLRETIHIVSVSPKMALVSSRSVLEYVVHDVYERRIEEPPGTRPLENLLDRLRKDKILPELLFANAVSIRMLGNVGAHNWKERVTVAEAYQSLTQLMPILEWYFEVERPEAGVRLDLPHEPHPTSVETEPKGGSRTHTAHVAVVPKGLRSFDAKDSDFFLQLLPGPRDKDGLPESIRFWKHRIEATDDTTFTVGVIYGPSGCGKSSLVKAGLLPRLDQRVVSIYVEATPEQTEARLLKGLRRKFAGIPADLNLSQALADLRQKEGVRADRKVLLVLDQFEQWLHAHRMDRDTELAQALRQCDGDHVQCVLMVRDDFWVSLTRFMEELSIEILQGQNTTLVDLFDPIHAQKVLAEFGRWYERLPHPPETLSKDGEDFLDVAVRELSEGGRVVPIRLALFAEMVKGKPWTPATLDKVGGTEGVGVSFLEEIFNGAALRPHQEAAREVLKALLPEGVTEIKGQMRSYDDLIVRAGYSSRVNEFDILLRTLDGEARLITPTHPEERASASGDRPDQGGRYYQLTHDYLVHSLGDWLDRNRRETRRGRAELRLADRSASWNSKSENRHLPATLEWANIRLLTRKRDWSEPQRRMMTRAGRVVGVRVVLTLALLGVGVSAGIAVRSQLIEYQRAAQAAGLVERVLDADTPQVPDIVGVMRDYRPLINPELKSELQKWSDDSRQKLHVSLFLLPVDDSQVDYLVGRLIKATPSELPVLRDALKSHHSTLTPKLWTVLETAKPGDASLLPSASALAVYDPQGTWQVVAGKVAQAIVSVNSIYLGDWLKHLSGVRSKLTPPLAAIFRDRKRSESERTQATDILADYAIDDPNVLSDLLMDSEEKLFAVLYEKLKVHKASAVTLMEAELARKPEPQSTADAKDQLAQRQARAAVALIRLGQQEKIWPLLRHRPDPSVRSFIVNWLKPLRAEPKAIMTRLNEIDHGPIPLPNDGQSRMRAILFHPETSERRALILALGEYDLSSFSPVERELWVANLLETYRTDPDAGIHGAAEWTVQRWGQRKKLVEKDSDFKSLKDRGSRRWFVNCEGQTLTVIEGPIQFMMGSMPTEPERDSDETAHEQRISLRFALATKEVTLNEYQRFLTMNPKIDKVEVDRHNSVVGGPINKVTWYEAAAYCNWLSEREHLSRCYEPNSNGEYAEGMKIVPPVGEKSGYRLPTEAEWEYSCRAGAVTIRYYGESEALIDKYACCNLNSVDRVWPCGQLKPNDFGLFDMLGNVFEWCQDEYGDYTPADDKQSFPSIIKDKTPRILRGGAFTFQPMDLRSADRHKFQPTNRNIGMGFRICKVFP